MMMLAAIAVLTGVVLGLRFNIIILFPAIIFGSAVTFAIGMASGNNQWTILLAMAVAITMLQMGYLGGAFIRVGITSHMSKGARAKTITVSQSPTL
jgi:hypothetical protein